MPSYDSIVVGEDWISEHYFTTDSPRESFQGKVIELDLAETDAAKAEADVKAMCEKLLANTVIEKYTVEIA